jgi:hypothetical protein
VPRDKDISWYQIFFEFQNGVGPSQSLISDFDNTNVGIFESLDSQKSTYSSKVRTDVIESGLKKNSVSFNYFECNPFSAGFDGWEQFLGRVNISWYDLGNKTLFLMADSKSLTSFGARILPSHERNKFLKYGNTYQTYIWTETKKETNTKYSIQKSLFNDYQIQLEKMIKEESIPRPSRTI